MGKESPEHPDLPAFLKRDVNNKAEFIKMSDSDVSETPESRPAKSKGKASAKANGHDKGTKAAKAPAKAAVKAAGKPKGKTAHKVAGKAETAPKATTKARKGSEKPKAAKSKAEVDQFGLRKGSAKSKAAAMYARKNGATLAEVKDALGSVQLNVLNGLEAEGYRVDRKKEKRDGERPVTRYSLKAKA